MKTTIDYCTGIHETGMMMTELRDVITELPQGYGDCPQDDKDRVSSSLHRFELAILESRSRMNAAGQDSEAVDQWLSEHEDELFDAANEDPDFFCSVYDAASESLELNGTPYHERDR